MRDPQICACQSSMLCSLKRNLPPGSSTTYRHAGRVCCIHVPDGCEKWLCSALALPACLTGGAVAPPVTLASTCMYMFTVRQVPEGFQSSLEKKRILIFWSYEPHSPGYLSLQLLEGGWGPLVVWGRQNSRRRFCIGEHQGKTAPFGYI